MKSEDLNGLSWLYNQNVLQNVPCNDSNEEEKLTSYQDSKYALDSYDPLIDTQIKPPYSFASLIFMAIDSSTKKALPVKDIYKWITDNFPYYKDAPVGWKNSVRHNLSLSRCFVKTSKNYNFSKGFLWTVDKKFRDNILQTINNQNLLLTQPELLLEREKSMFRDREPYLDDIDAAAVMLVIKHSNNASNGNSLEEKSNEIEQAEKLSGSLKRKRSTFEMKKNTTYSDNTLFQSYRRRNALRLSAKISDDHNYTSETIEKIKMNKLIDEAKENSMKESCMLNRDDADGVSALLNLSRNGDDHVDDDQNKHDGQETDQKFQPRLLRRFKQLKSMKNDKE